MFEIKQLVKANGTSPHDQREIGFSNSLHVPRILGGSDQVPIQEYSGEKNESKSGSESDSCDSETELNGPEGTGTADLTKQNEYSEYCSDNVSISVPSSPEFDHTRKTTNFPKQSGKFKSVGFLNVDTMDNSDTNSKKQEINKDLSKLSRKGTGSVRYTQPRLSLLGKPINYKQHKRDARYRRIQSRIYNFLERPKIWYAFLYHIAM